MEAKFDFMRDLNESLARTYQRVFDDRDKRQHRIDESLRKLAALSANPLIRKKIMRRILGGFRLDKVDELCIEPKQKNS